MLVLLALMAFSLFPEFVCDEWHRLGEYEYFVGRSCKLNFSQALAACEARNGSPAKVNSSDIQTFLVEKLINFTGPAGSITYYIGLTRVNKTAFQWTDGDLLGYVNWNFGEPDDHLTVPDECVALEKRFNFSWVDIDCGRLGNFVCQKFAGTHISDATTYHIVAAVAGTSLLLTVVIVMAILLCRTSCNNEATESTSANLDEKVVELPNQFNQERERATEAIEVAVYGDVNTAISPKGNEPANLASIYSNQSNCGDQN